MTDLRSARKKLGLTQAELARLLGYSRPATISDVEHGREQMSQTARRLLAAYVEGYRPQDWPLRESR